MIDNSAFIHVTPQKKFFTNNEPDNFGTIKMGNGGLVKMIGNGNVCLGMSNDTILVLRDESTLLISI